MPVSGNYEDIILNNYDNLIVIDLAHSNSLIVLDRYSKCLWFVFYINWNFIIYLYIKFILRMQMTVMTWIEHQINTLIELKKRRINKQSHPVALCTIFILNNNAFSSAYNTSIQKALKRGWHNVVRIYGPDLTFRIRQIK